jgi:hypothetical protein
LFVCPFCCRSGAGAAPSFRVVRFCFSLQPSAAFSFLAGCHPQFPFSCACCCSRRCSLQLLRGFSAGATLFVPSFRRERVTVFLSAVTVCHPHAAPLRVISFRRFVAACHIADDTFPIRVMFALSRLASVRVCSLRPCSTLAVVVCHLHSVPLRVIRYGLIDGMSNANDTFPYLIGVMNAAAGAAVVCLFCMSVFFSVSFCCVRCRVLLLLFTCHTSRSLQLAIH